MDASDNAACGPEKSSPPGRVGRSVDLSDPDFEPTDDDLIGLSRRAFAHVATDNARHLELLRIKIAREADRVLADLDEKMPLS